MTSSHRSIVEYIQNICFRRREIARKKKYECSKCMYDIPPFTPHFDPESHNEFTRRRTNFLTRNNEKMLLEGILRQKVEENYRGIFERKFSWRQLLCEILLFGESDPVAVNIPQLIKSLCPGFIVFLVPLTILSLELFFNHATVFSHRGPV